MIRLTVPSIEDDDLEAVREVLISGFLVQGKHVEAFEHRVAEYVGSAHAVAVSNCTAALHLALVALGIGRGDRVAVGAYSWPASANVIVLAGAEPVFVDIDPETFNICPAALEAALVKTKVKAILPIHTFGGVADLPSICRLAQQYGVPVLEDAACALGAEFSGKKAGRWGAAGCFSFHPRKAVTTGEGGMVVTDDASIARKIRVLRNHGLDPSASSPDFVEAGHNLRLTEFQGALGVTQLTKLERIIEKRQAAGAIYRELFKRTELKTPVAMQDSRHVFQSYVCLLPKRAADRRSEIIAALKTKGIETNIGTYHMPMTSFFRGRYEFAAGDFPVTDDVFKRAISLPLYETLTQADQEFVATALLNLIA